MNFFYVTVLCLLAHASSYEYVWIPIKSFTWFHNSKDFCLTLFNQQGHIAINTTLQVSYGSETAKVEVGNHACHDGTPSLDMCGYLPEGVDATMMVTPKYLDATMLWKADFPDRTGIQEFHGTIEKLGPTEGQTSPVSIHDRCLLYDDKCTKCHQPCSFVRQGKSEMMCDGRLISGDDVFLQKIEKDQEMPFQVDVESVVDITNRNLLCVNLKKPVHKLGNIWQYLEYKQLHLKTVYFDENDVKQTLDSVGTDVCSDVSPMKSDNDTTAFCTRYLYKPKQVIRIQGSIGIQGYNLMDKKYSVIEESGFRRKFKMIPTQLFQADACSVQDHCTQNECLQTCKMILTNNSYTCNGTLHPSPVHDQERNGSFPSDKTNQGSPTFIDGMSKAMSKWYGSLFPARTTAHVKEAPTPTPQTNDITTVHLRKELSSSSEQTNFISTTTMNRYQGTTSRPKYSTTEEVSSHQNIQTTESSLYHSKPEEQPSSVPSLHETRPNYFTTSPEETTPSMKREHTSSDDELPLEKITTGSISSVSPRLRNVFHVTQGQRSLGNKEASVYTTESQNLPSDNHPKDIVSSSEQLNTTSHKRSNVFYFVNSSPMPCISCINIIPILIVCLLSV